jgi:hypothetical protein
VVEFLLGDEARLVWAEQLLRDQTDFVALQNAAPVHIGLVKKQPQVAVVVGGFHPHALHRRAAANSLTHSLTHSFSRSSLFLRHSPRQRRPRHSLPRTHRTLTATVLNLPFN